MFSNEQLSAITGGLIEDVRTLGDRTKSLREQMDAIRNDELLSEAGRVLNLKPLECRQYHRAFARKHCEKRGRA
jgi:hypothetical protein